MWTFSFERASELLRTDPVLPGLDEIIFSHSIDGQFMPFHAHDEFHLLFCVGGSGYLRTNNTEIQLSAGTLCLIKPGVLHSCGAADTELDFWGLSFFPGGNDDRLAASFSKCDILSASFKDYMDYVNGSFSLLHELCETTGNNPYPLENVRSLVFSLLYFSGMILEKHPREKYAVRDLPMQDVMHWMIDHFSEDITLDRLARQFAMSTSHLSRSFYQAFQVSPINYLIDYRLSRAKDLLIFTDKPIHEISSAVGYSNAYHFSNLFSKRIGTTPQQFREYCRNNIPQPSNRETSSGAV